MDDVDDEKDDEDEEAAAGGPGYERPGLLRRLRAQVRQRSQLELVQLLALETNMIYLFTEIFKTLL